MFRFSCARRHLLLITTLFTAAVGTAVGVAESAPHDLSNLTLSGAFAIALRANKDIRIATLEQDAAEIRVSGAEGEFDPIVFFEAGRGRSDHPLADTGAADTTGADLGGGARTRIETGTEIEVAATATYDRDRGGGGGLNPRYGTELTVTVSQDLLKDFGVDINRTEILVRQNDAKRSAEALRDTIMQTLFDVEQTYWDYYFASADLEVRRQQQQRAEQLVKRAEAQVDVGEAAPIEITRARSGAAAQEIAILTAENRIRKLHHRLLERMGILGRAQSDTPVHLADEPVGELVRVTLDDALAVAAVARPGLVQAKLAIENAGLRERFTRNQRLPSVVLSADVGLDGLDDDYAAGTDELAGADHVSWDVRLMLEVPLGNRSARAEHEEARFAQNQAVVEAEALLQSIELEVRDAFADLQTAAGRIAAAQQARALTERLLEAEETSFRLGRTDSLNVLNAQAAAATSQRDELLARTDYTTALANLYRVRGDLLEQKRIAVLSD